MFSPLNLSFILLVVTLYYKRKKGYIASSLENVRYIGEKWLAE